MKLLILISLIFLINLTNGCSKLPRHLNPGRRSRGDNGYKLIIGNSPSGYTPGKTYNLLLLGSRNHTKVQHFTHFAITAEGVYGTRRTPVVNPLRSGRFQLFADSLTKFNERCINTVSEADDLPKTEIQVMWVAPQSGSGCVSLSAMVYEGPGSWFADQGQLTKVICEAKPDVHTVKKECCACNEAKYNFIFEGIWSNETHPKDYPYAIWLTHFSDVIGATHDTNFTFWGENHIATDGFRSLAEWGSPSALEAELRTNGPRLRSLFKAPGLWYPNVNNNSSATFRTDRKHHKVSMVSMFGPSPDWVVGISGVDLCTEDCSWKESLEFDLYPWDAGTDSGISYMSANAETFPREKMHRITTMYPEDPRAPFYNPKAQEITPLAKLYVRREKIISRNCDDDFLQALQLDTGDSDSDYRSECRVSEYSEWTPCSVTCGKGLRTRTRKYLNEGKANQADCKRQLIFKEMCVARIPECQESPRDDDEGENLSNSESLVNANGEGIGICTTTPWSPWSDCSASCGIGIKMQTRTFINHAGRKHCPHVSTVIKEKCMLPDCKLEDIELPDPDCPVSSWSDWSPCLHGSTVRSRLLLVEDHLLDMCNTRMKLNEQKECKSPSENFDPSLAYEICKQSSDSGPCRGSYKRFAYDYNTGRCHSFTYGGCRGNKNNFINEQQCMKSCRILDSSTTVTKPANSNSNTPKNIYDEIPVDCVMSEWSNWSECDVKCGSGYSTRNRHIVKYPINGGQECPKKQTKKRRCTLADC